MPKVYAVKVGRQTGIFRTWSDCQASVTGFGGALFKSFPSESSALAWLQPASSDVLPSSDCVAGATPSSSESYLEPGESPSTSAASSVSDQRAAFFLWTDGASRGNPGPASYGWVLRGPFGSTRSESPELLRQLPLVDRDLGYIGINTNNVAEYTALNNALKRISSQHPSVRHLHVRCDSELLIRQVNGVYISRNKVLSPIIASIQAYSKSFTSIEFQWIPRELNSEADQLTNDALDNRAVVVDSDPVDELDSLPPSKRRRIEDDLYTPEF